MQEPIKYYGMMDEILSIISTPPITFTLDAAITGVGEIKTLHGDHKDDKGIVFLKCKKAGFTKEETEAMLNKIQRDGFMDKNSNGYWIITLEGIIFEGYVNRENRLDAEYAAVVAQNQRTERNDERLVKWTKWLYFATVGLVVVEVLIHWNELTHLFFS